MYNVGITLEVHTVCKGHFSQFVNRIHPAWYTSLRLGFMLFMWGIYC